MRLSSHDEVIAIYDRAIRLVTSIEVTLDHDQRAELFEMLLRSGDENGDPALKRVLTAIARYVWESTDLER